MSVQGKADEVFIRQFIMVLVLLVIYTIAAAILGRWVAAEAARSQAARPEAVLERVRPVGSVAVAPRGGQGGAPPATSQGTAPAPAPAPASPPAPTQTAAASARSGEEVYKSTCMACHMTGAANAPRVRRRCVR